MTESTPSTPTGAPGPSGPSGSSGPVVVRVSGPAGLIVSLPALLGFTPQRSLVAIAMRTSNGRTRVGATVRVDLPATAAEANLYVEAVVARLAPTDPAWVQLIVIADHHAAANHDAAEAIEPAADGAGGLPCAGLVTTLRAGFAAVAVETRAPLWTPLIAVGAPWGCYDECGCTGTLPDPQASDVAFHTALRGGRVNPARGDAEAALAADPDAASPTRRALLDEAMRAATWARVGDRDRAIVEDLAAVRDAAAALGRGDTPDNATLARVAVSLGDPAVRDVAAGYALGRDPRIAPGDADALWRLLTRTTPAPEVAEPATLAAFAALRTGGGAPLSVALERAIDADPSHRLSRLLARALAAGISPEQIEHTLLAGAAGAEDPAQHHQSG